MYLQNNKNIKKLFYFHEKLKLYAFSNFKTFIYYIYMYLIQLKVVEVIKSSNESKFIESMSSHPTINWKTFIYYRYVSYSSEGYGSD